MIATLTFNLPEEYLEFKQASNASNLFNVIFELDNYLRSEIKYKDNSTEVDLSLQRIRDYLNELCSDSGIVLHG